MAEAVARQADTQATIACYQDDVHVVATPHAESFARSTFIEEMRKIGLVVHKLSVFTPPGRQPHPDRQLRQDPRALILRHGAPCPVLVMQDVSSEGDTMTHSDSPEVHQLLAKRSGMTQRLLQLRDAGLPTQFASAMFRYAIAGDATFLARTCGIPPRAQIDLTNCMRTPARRRHYGDISATHFSAHKTWRSRHVECHCHSTGRVHSLMDCHSGQASSVDTEVHPGTGRTASRAVLGIEGYSRLRRTHQRDGHQHRDIAHHSINVHYPR